MGRALGCDKDVYGAEGLINLPGDRLDTFDRNIIKSTQGKPYSNPMVTKCIKNNDLRIGHNHISRNSRKMTPQYAV